MEIKFHKTFKKKFRKLPPQVQRQFYKRLDLFLKNRSDRILNNHAVDKAFPDCRSISITGDYRAIFQDQEEAVVFMIMGTHSDLYS